MPPAALVDTVVARSATETQAIAQALGRAMDVGDVLALNGPLGAGKTTFAQGVAAGLGVPPDRHVASPTFALCNEHMGRVPFVHADLYRIESERELMELGLDEAMDRAAVAIEWAERFAEVLPADYLTITLCAAESGERRLAGQASGPRSQVLLQTLLSAAREKDGRTGQRG